MTKVLKNKRVSCVIKYIGFAIKNELSVLFSYVYITYVEVNISVEKPAIHFYRLKLAAETYRL